MYFNEVWNLHECSTYCEDVWWIFSFSKKIAYLILTAFKKDVCYIQTSKFFQFCWNKYYLILNISFLPFIFLYKNKMVANNAIAKLLFALNYNTNLVKNLLSLISGPLDIFWCRKCNWMDMLCYSNFVCLWFYCLPRWDWNAAELAVASWGHFCYHVLAEFVIKCAKIAFFGHLRSDVHRCIANIF